MPVCYRCGTTNPLLTISCVSCGHEFIRSYCSFDILPLVTPPVLLHLFLLSHLLLPYLMLRLPLQLLVLLLALITTGSCRCCSCSCSCSSTSFTCPASASLC